MQYVFDIDGTICSFTGGSYKDAVPYTERIKEVNRLFAEGHTIIFYTARGMGSTNNNFAAAYAKMYDVTEKQLKSWGVKYHSLFLGKPYGDIYVDDRGVSDNEFFKGIKKE